MHTRLPLGSLPVVLALSALVAAPACDSGGTASPGCTEDASCGAGNACVNHACLTAERCGTSVCSAAEVCDGAACIASPYDRDYILVLDHATSTTPRDMSATIRLAGSVVIRGQLKFETQDPTWDVAARVHIGRNDAFSITIDTTESRPALIDEVAARVPLSLLLTGTYTAQGSTGVGVILRARPADDASVCVIDGDCAGTTHCELGLCVAGERCGRNLHGAPVFCGADKICGDNACIDDPLAAGPYTLTLVGASLLHATWDTGFDDGVPDPTATVWLDGVSVIEGPEQSNTFDATWNLSVTQTFDTFSTLRVRIVDTDVNGFDVAIDETFPRIPYALVRDGTLTIRDDVTGTATLRLAPADPSITP